MTDKELNVIPAVGLPQTVAFLLSTALCSPQEMGCDALPMER